VSGKRNPPPRNRKMPHETIISVIEKTPPIGKLDKIIKVRQNARTGA
jgi:hypothetical protein